MKLFALTALFVTFGIFNAKAMTENAAVEKVVTKKSERVDYSTLKCDKSKSTGSQKVYSVKNSDGRDLMINDAGWNCEEFMRKKGFDAKQCSCATRVVKAKTNPISESPRGDDDDGSTNGGSTNGGSTNGGSTNGGSTNGGSTNGGSTNGHDDDGHDDDGHDDDGHDDDGHDDDGHDDDGHDDDDDGKN